MSAHCANMRNRAESAGCFQERAFRLFLESTSDVVVALAQNGDIHWASSSIERVLGFTVEEVTRATLFEYIDPEDLSLATQTLEEGAQDASDHHGIEMRFRHRNGSVRVLEVIGSGLLDDLDIQGIMFILHDVTERNRTEEALRRSESRFRSLAEGTSETLTLTDAEGVITYKSSSVGPILGYHPDEFLGKNVFSFIHPDDIPGLRESLVEGLANSSHLACMPRLRFLHKDGSWHVLECVVDNLLSDPEVKAVVIRSRDITSRQHAEEARNRLGAILEASPDLVGTADPDGRILFINRAGRQMLGVTADKDVTGIPIGSFLPAWADELIGTVGIPTALREGTWTGRTALLTQDGREIPASQVILAHRSAAGAVEYLSTIVRDLSERERAEAALRKSEARYRLVFETMAQGIAFFDSSGRILSANPAAEEILGFSASEMRGRTSDEFPWKIVREDGTDFPWKERPVVQAIETGEAVEGVVMEFVHPDQEESRWIEVRAVPLLHLGEALPYQVYTIFEDVTERRRAADVLRESEERFRLMVEGSEQVFFYLHDREGVFEYLSPSIAYVLGYEPAELVGRSYRDVLTGDPSDVQVEENTQRTLISGAEPSIYTALTRHKDGRKVWIELVETAVIRKGVIVGVRGFARDVTERVQAEERLRKNEEELRQAQKMEAVGRLAGGVAHDFNNILTAIKGNTQMLLMDVPDGSPLREDLREIDHSVDRATNLTRQLLAFSRKEITRTRSLDLNAIISDMEKMLRRLLREDIEFTTRFDPDLRRINADVGQIEQVLMNLAVNARDAMPHGGSLVVETHNIELTEEDTPEGRDALPGPYVLLTVSDTGEGMTKEVQDRVFEPFFTTKPKGKGTGMGLSTVYGIVKQRGGFIGIDSQLCHGTTFRIFLPQTTETLTQGVSAPELASGSARSGTILLVEDEAAVRSVARRCLERSGFTILEAQSGEEALRLCEAQEEPIHLLITDVVMPHMSGRVLAERVRSLYPDMRVLFMSGYPDDEIPSIGAPDWEATFIQKPFSPDRLARRVREMLDAKAQS